MTNLGTVEPLNVTQSSANLSLLDVLLGHLLLLSGSESHITTTLSITLSRGTDSGSYGGAND